MKKIGKSTVGQKSCASHAFAKKWKTCTGKGTCRNRINTEVMTNAEMDY